MTELSTSTLGQTGLEVTSLGFGAMELRGKVKGLGTDIDDAKAERLLNAVLDAGINLIDTAPDYGPSEDLIGRYLSRRRSEFYLATKCGCPIETGAPARVAPEHVFTRQHIRAGVEESLRRLRTDHLDIVQLHMNPSREVLEEHDSLAELELMRSEGKLRFVGISSILPETPAHLDMGVFDTFQLPYSALEREHEQTIRDAAALGAGTIVRGGVARGVPDPSEERFAELPERWRTSLAERHRRFERVQLDDLLSEIPFMELMLRFTLSHPSLHSVIVGTASLDHLAANVAAARKGPLPPELYAQVSERFAPSDKSGSR